MSCKAAKGLRITWVHWSIIDLIQSKWRETGDEVTASQICIAPGKEAKDDSTLPVKTLAHESST